MTQTPSRRVAITGATGNLGRRLRRHWQHRSDLDLRLIDLRPGGDTAVMAADLSQWEESWVEALTDVDTIVHLAAQANPFACWADLTGPNVDAVLHLYRAAEAKGVSRVILASSVWAMAGRADDPLPIEAGDPDPGGNAYGATKLFAERIARASARAGGPVTVALRIGGCPPGANPPIHKEGWEDQCWLSGDDFLRGLDAALDAPVKGFVAVNLTSEIPDGRWDLTASHAAIGYAPQDVFDPPPVVKSKVSPHRAVVRALRRGASALVRRARSQVEIAVAAGCELGEAPLWDRDRRSVWFLDISGRRLHRHGPDAVPPTPLPDQAGMLALDEEGRLLVGLGTTLRRFDDDALGEPLATLDTLEDVRINDGCVDASGVLWFGSMDRQASTPLGRLHRFDGSTLSTLGPRWPVVNGPAFSPDGRLLYLSDTVGGAVWRFETDGKTLDDGRPFITIAPGDGAPDGLAVDAEGCLWVSLWGGWAVRRYAPDGRLLRIVRCPCANITKLAFGGPDFRTAYVTSAAIGLTRGGRRDQPAAGALFHFQTPTPGLPVHRFTTKIDLHPGT